MNDLFNFRSLSSGDMEQKKSQLLSWAVVILILGAVFLAVKSASAVKNYRYIGAGILPTNTISVSGEGEVFAVPDIAEVTFSVQVEKKTVAEAQREATSISNAAIDFLKNSGIEERDIKTLNYSAYPKYEYQTDGAIMYPRPGKQVLVGYSVNQTISVKIRDTEKVSAVLEGLGKLKVTDISGPNFSIDDDETLKSEAREGAIKDAKMKAKKLSRSLGVRLTRIISFSESGDYPIYYAKGMAIGMGGDAEVSSAPSLPKGENRIVSNVTITYEIR